MELSDFACWATGDFPDSVPGSVQEVVLDDPDLSLPPNWGNEGDEFVADLRDLGNDVLLLMELKAEYLEGHDPSPDSDEEKVYTLFDSMSELVDYTFAFDFSTEYFFNNDHVTDDRRFMRMAAEFGQDIEYPIDTAAWSSYPLEDRRFLLPWDSKDKYLERRRVAVPYENVVQSFNGQWIDPANPGGGRVLDFVALARDQAANRLEALEGTVSAAGDGGVVHYGTIEAVAQQFTFQSDNSCSGPSCSGVTRV